MEKIEIYKCRLDNVVEGKCKYANSVFCPLGRECMYVLTPKKKCGKG